jgi:uncharacterized membrane protein
LKNFGILLTILVVTSLLVPILIITVAARPVGRHPDQPNWPGGTPWGGKLRYENASTGYVDEDFFGPGREDFIFDNSEWTAGAPGGWIGVALLGDDGLLYSKLCLDNQPSPQRYTWTVALMTGGTAPVAGGKLWCDWENSTTLFVPQDYYIVLENSATFGHFNMRAENRNLPAGTAASPKYAILHVDNAVNIQSIENLDPLTGKPGDPLRLRVTVKNTGRYTDNYTVSAGGSLDPTIPNLAENHTDNVIVTTTYPLGTENIVITAAGNYATDQDYITASGLLVKKVKVEITPNENFGENGETLTFDVLVKNIGDFVDNYKLTVENIWEAFVSPAQLDNLNPGDNMHATLFVKIPDNANSGDSDNVNVTVTSMENVEVSDNAKCIARMGSYSVEVSILPGYQDNAPGGTLNYTVTVSNTGTLNDSYNLIFSDNIDGNNYWEDNISLENSSLAVPAGEYRTTTLMVTIPDNAPTSTNDNITVTATSQVDNTVSASSSCIANVACLSITISPEYQSGLPGVTLTYIVDIKNNENADGDYYSVVTDNLGWKLAFGIKRVILYPLGEVWTILKVTIPENAIGRTDDNVTVTMVSMDNMVSYSALCVANVIIVRGVKVSITPGENRGIPGATLGYIVTVNNTGNVEDNYGLTASDDAGWTLEFLPPNLIIPPRGSENAVLNVTILENAAPLILDNITVTATSQENENASAENSCTALSLAVFKLHLLQGWNLVGFPLTSENTTPTNLFGNNLMSVKYWIAPRGPYIEPDYNTPVQDNLGYWVQLKENQDVILSGVPPENRTLYLVAGWNLVGFPLTSENTTPTNLFGNNLMSVKYWIAPRGPYIEPDYKKPVELGVGYWVQLKENQNITIPL